MALLIIEPSGANMENSHPDPSLLHRHPDLLPLHNLPPIKKPFMCAARIYHGPGCPALGPDAPEHLKHVSTSPLDGSANRKWSCETVIVFVVGCSTSLSPIHRCHFPHLLRQNDRHLADTRIIPSGFGMIHPPSNPHPPPHALPAHRVANPRLPNNDSRASHSAS